MTDMCLKKVDKTFHYDYHKIHVGSILWRQFEGLPYYMQAHSPNCGNCYTNATVKVPSPKLLVTCDKTGVHLYT